MCAYSCLEANVGPEKRPEGKSAAQRHRGQTTDDGLKYWRRT